VVWVVQVDYEEFLLLWQLVVAGDTKGLGGGLFSSLVPEARKAREAKKQAFRSAVAAKRGGNDPASAVLARRSDARASLTVTAGERITVMQKRAREGMGSTLASAKRDYESRGVGSVLTEAQDLGRLGSETVASVHRGNGEKTADSTAAAEHAAYMRKMGRRHMGMTLASARDEWDRRDHHTKTDDIGRLALATESSRHHHDAKTASNTSAAESGAHMRLHGRSMMGMELAAARDEYAARDHVTKPDDIGRLGHATVASSHHRDDEYALIVAAAAAVGDQNVELTLAREAWEARERYTQPDSMGRLDVATVASQHKQDAKSADTMSDVEYHAYMQRHKREALSSALLQAKDEWQLRDHHTKPSNIGNLERATEASKHRHDVKDADNTSMAEAMAHAMAHKRDLLSTELTAAKQAWEQRDTTTTVADNIGRLAVHTASSAHARGAKDADSMAGAEHAAYAQRHKRSLMSQDLVRAKEEWESRSHSTVADDIGHLAVATAATRHKQDAKDVDHMAEAEYIAYVQTHNRSLMSKELAKAKEAWGKRDHATVAVDVGRLGHQLQTAKYNADHKDADHMADSEFAAYMQLHNRDLMSLELLRAKEAWEKRDHATVADDVGRFGHQQESAKFRAGMKDSNHMADSEYIAYMSKHERELLSVLATQSGDRWKLRLRDGQIYRPAPREGSNPTPSEPRVDIESHVGESERMKRDALKSRDSLSTEGTTAREAWLKRRVSPSSLL